MTYEIRKLREVFAIKKGRKPELHLVKKPDDVPYLVAKVMRGAQEPEWVRRDDPNAVLVTEDEAIIICDGSNSGEVFSGFSGALSSTMAKIEPKVPIDQTYLRRFLESNAELFAGTKTGTAIPHLDQDAMFNLQIPLPPLPEQQRIVRLLDEAFEGIAIAKANAERNRHNAQALFESQLQALLERGREGWETKSVGEVCTFKRGLTYAKTDEVDVSENVVLRAMNIDLATNRLDFGELKYIDDKVVVSDEKKVKSGSLMICMASGSKSHLGKVAIIEQDYGYAFGGFMGMLTPSTNLLPRYLFYVMTSTLYKNFIGSMSAGANINNLTFDKLSAFTFPIPPLNEQQHIVAMLNKIETSTSRLAAAYLAKSRAAENLGTSLLSQAFSGKWEAA